jgi:hypothetical protein
MRTLQGVEDRDDNDKGTGSLDIRLDSILHSCK